MKEYQVTVTRNGREQLCSCREGENLLEALTRQGIYISAACGGKGRCGKCGVRFSDGTVPVTEADRHCFSEEQIAEGMRLSCEVYLQADCRIEIESTDEADFDVVTDYRQKNSLAEHADTAAGTGKEGSQIAIDIGTTTLAASLVDAQSGEILHAVTGVNHQRAYGADVISRIQAANDGKLEELSQSIRRDLCGMICRLLSESGAALSGIRRIAIAGNTTMGHLLMGYSCETLGVYPFDPVNIDTTEVTFGELFGEAGAEDTLREEGAQIPVVLLPGISTYVGADISAGMLSCGFDCSEKVNVLIDLGTNGEMAIGNRERILVTSTAAGPAFEGGNISCGMGSVPGAICQVQISGTEVSCGTIGDRPPVGLCGTGVIETACELLKAELIDETGMLDEDYFDDGFVLAKTPSGEEISFTQKDVREIQLAKAAVRAGLETLMLRYGVTYDDIDTLYLAGGFGFHLNLEKAAAIGLIPEELLDRAKAVGNSSLGGAAVWLTEPGAAERMERIIAVSEEIPLASDKDFNQFYMDSMFFEV